MKLTKYPDGTSYINSPIMGQTTFKLNSYEDLWHLNQFVDAFKDEYTSKPTILIPNLLDAQADRRFNKGESSGLKLVCNFLNNMDANFKIFHPHNPEVVEALVDNVKIVDNTYFIKEVLSELYCNKANIKRDEGLFYHTNLDNLILASSDAGGFKPLMKLCEKLDWKGETFSASKSRKYSDGETKLTQSVGLQDFEGKDILIVDDICVYGGTFKGLANLFRERNCGKLYLAISHLTIENHKGNDHVFKYFDKVFTSNSKFDSYWIEDKKGGYIKPDNLRVVNLF